MTGSTTIKVSRTTRDRLKAQAAAAHISLGAHLERLADAADRDARLAALREAAVRAPLDGSEVDAWEQREWNPPRA